MTSEFEDPPADDALDPSRAARNQDPMSRMADFGRGPARVASDVVHASNAPQPTRPPMARPPLQPFESYDQPGLRNPYVLAGIAVFGAIVLAMLVVFVFGGHGSSTAGSQANGVSVAALTPVPGRGIAAKSIATATVRSGPGLEYDAIAELARNQDVEVIGRNADSTWYAIYYPP